MLNSDGAALLIRYSLISLCLLGPSWLRVRKKERKKERERESFVYVVVLVVCFSSQQKKVQALLHTFTQFIANCL